MILIGRLLLVDQFDVDAATPVDLRGLGTAETTHYVLWGEGVSAGTIEIESASTPEYAGQWAPVATVTFDGSVDPAPKQEYVRAQGVYAAMRHRISSPVLGGTVSTKIEGSGDW